ncbi:MAG: carboxypeptidase regulatory-like domain-containing protein [Kofleriaceae bacterium]
MRRAGLFAVLVAIALVIVWRLHGPSSAREAATVAHRAGTPTDPSLALKTSSLGGRVTRASDGAPIARAFISVRLEAMEHWSAPVVVRTNPDGEWRALVAAGSYAVAANAPGFIPKQSDPVEVAQNQASTVSLVLDAGGSVLRGTVTDIGGGPIVGATVFVDPASVTTDVDGHYAIAVVDGTHDLGVTDEDYCSTFEQFAISGADATVDVQLVPGASVRGDVIARDTHAAIPGATISIYQGDERKAEENADAEGHFVVHQLHTARMLISARAPGYASRGEQGFEVGPGETAGPIHLVLDHAFSISGLVMWKERGNQPASGMNVRAFSSGPRSIDAWTTTRSDGTFVIDGVTPGLYAIQIHDNDSRRLDGAPIEVRDHDVVDQLYAIARGVKVTGRLEPAGLGEIGLWGERSFGDEVHSDGTFSFRGVVPGSYRARATTSDNHEGELAVEVGESDVTNLIVKVDTSPRATVSGKVVDDEGAPVASAMVAVEDRLASTDATGHFSVTGLLPGKHLIAASRDRPMFGAHPSHVDAPSENNVVTIESRHSKISGRVLRADHEPAADTWVTATRIEAPDLSVAITSALTAADGTFTIAPLSKGVYSIVARDKRDGAKVEVARVAAGATISIELDPLSSLSGHVTSGGRPVDQYELRCGFGDLQQNIYSPEGAFHFEHVQPGYYLCKATTRGGTAEASLTIGAAPAQLELVVRAYGSVTGALVNAFTGKPVTGLLAFTDSVSESYLARGPAVSDASGQFIVERVPAGDGAIEISSSRDLWPGAQSLVRYSVADGERADLGEIRVLPARHGRAGTFGMKTQNLEVIELTPGGPAELAGIRKGDDITAVEGISIGTLPRQVLGALLFDDVLTAGDTYHFELARGVTVAVTAN